MVDVAPVRYDPHDVAYELDIELLDAAELRARVASNPQRGFERIDFQCFLFVRSGSYTHVVDFETHSLTAGSCLVISPGQVHRFGPPSRWSGWMLIVNGHRVSDDTRDLPTHVRLDEEPAAAVDELLARIKSDTRLEVETQLLVQLLALETAVLVGRLALGSSGTTPNQLLDAGLLLRYRSYRDAVENHYQHWHSVAAYANELGYSAKSLNRACRGVADTTAKDVIVARTILEAKRRLALTDDTISSISRQLGFDEATNFVKFFRRVTTTTPSAFRASVNSPDTQH